MEITRPSLSTKALWCASALAAACLSGCEQRKPQGASATPAVVKTPSGVEMVRLPGGWFAMGSDDEEQTDETPHRVCVSPFYIDTHEVTQEEYEKLMGKNPSRWKAKGNPVEQIRWADAAAYCNARSRAEGLRPAYDPKTWECDFAGDGYRLPTEPEWEYAARAGTTTRHFFGDSPARLSRYAWFKENRTRGPRPVAMRQPNPWGLHDVYGNVWEWCNDFYAADYYQKSPARNPTGPKTAKTKVLRGGCWNSRPDMCRSSYRNDEDPGYTDVCFGADVHGFVGFRCVRRKAED